MLMRYIIIVLYVQCAGIGTGKWSFSFGLRALINSTPPPPLLLWRGNIYVSGLDGVWTLLGS
jgi:hypothetical protein